MEGRPIVSVLMAVYNKEGYLPACLDSVLGQTLSDIEFVVVEDGSEDASGAILQEYAERDPRLRILWNEENIGLTKSLNRGLSEAKGEYIARMDADDVSYPSRLERQLAELRENPDLGAVGTWYEEIDGKGRVIGTRKPPADPEGVRKMMIKTEAVAHPTMMLPRRVFEEVGPYNEEWRYAQESELYFRILARYEMANVPEVLYQWRRTADTITHEKHRQALRFFMKAQLKAVREGVYGPASYVHVLRSVVSYLVPRRIKVLVRRSIT